MNCPRCKHPKTGVVCTVQLPGCVLRYRKCQGVDCGFTFKTTETAEKENNLPFLNVEKAGFPHP